MNNATRKTSNKSKILDDRQRLLIGVGVSLTAHLLFVGWTAFDWGRRGVGIGESAQSGASASGAASVSLALVSAKPSLPARKAQATKTAKPTEPVKVAAVPAKAKPRTPLHPSKSVRPAPTKPPVSTASKSPAVPPTGATATPAPAVSPVKSAPENVANPSTSAPAPTHSSGIAVLTAPQAPLPMATPESPRPAAPLPTEDETTETSTAPVEPMSKTPPTPHPVAVSGDNGAASPDHGSIRGVTSGEIAALNAASGNSGTPVRVTVSVSTTGGASSASGAATSEGGPATGGQGRGVPFASAGGGGSVGPDATRIAYVLDVSGSMKEEGKIDAARLALLQAVAGLHPGDHFTFILFSDRVRPLTTGLISAADVASVKQLEDKFLATVPYGETDLSDALDRALDLPGIQRVFLLSDGGPTLGIVDYDDLADHIREKTHGGSVHISTFALGAGEQFEGVNLLRRIAQENGGDYTYVKVAPGSNGVAANQSVPSGR